MEVELEFEFEKDSAHEAGDFEAYEVPRSVEKKFETSGFVKK